MASCELLNAARRAAVKKGLPLEPVSSCTYLNIGACEGVDRQRQGERVAPACYIIPEAVTRVTYSGRVELFQQRALITQMGRRPLPGII